MGHGSAFVRALAIMVTVILFVRGQDPYYGGTFGGLNFNGAPSSSASAGSPGLVPFGTGNPALLSSQSQTPILASFPSGNPSTSSVDSAVASFPLNPPGAIISSPGPGGSSGSAASSASPAQNPHIRPRGHRPKFFGDPLEEFKIVCLFNNKHYYKGELSPAMIDPTLCTHLNYEFAILDPKSYEMITGEPDLDLQQDFYQEAIDLKKRNENLKVLISLGGWDDTTKKYSEMAADEARRKNFIEKAVSFIISHEFDGLDIAWEYPNCWQGAINVSPKDKENFVKLLEETKIEFDKKNLILSVSVGAIKREIEAAYDVPRVSAAVNHINVMTYDMHGPWEPVTGHHTQFEKMEGDIDPYCNVKSALQVWIDHGADRKKLNMGLALYAKTFTLANVDNNDLGAPALGIGNPGPLSQNGGFLNYNEICKYLNNGTWTEKEVKQVGYYAYSDDQWACYDPPMMVVKKAKYVVEADLGGVLLKDLSGDDYEGSCFSMPFPLLKMCHMEIASRVRKRFLHRSILSP